MSNTRNDPPPGIDADYARFAAYVARLSRQQRSLLFFAIAEALFADYRGDGKAEGPWVEAAYRTYLQSCTLLIRACGHTTKAMELDAAAARTPDLGGSAARH